MANNPNQSKSQSQSQEQCKTNFGGGAHETGGMKSQPGQSFGSQGNTGGGQGGQSASQHKEHEGGGGTSTMQQAASYVADKAKSAASSVASSASSAASYVGGKAEDATSAVAGGIKSVAGSIRDYGPQRDMMGNATGAVADTIESAGRYLEEQGLSGIADDITAAVRRNPIPALFIAVGVGFLIARATTSRSY